MKKFLKWLFIAPIVFFGVWLIALYWEKFRDVFIKSIDRTIEVCALEIERSLDKWNLN